MRSEESTGDAVYHVVCRDCPFEDVEAAGVDAERAASAHADESDHTVVYGRID